MANGKEKSINKDGRKLAIDDCIMEIESYLYFRQQKAVVVLALELLRNKHGEKARQEVIDEMELKGYLDAK